jgi:hypothetical protein
MSKKKKTQHVGTIDGVETLLSAPTGHRPHFTGTGAHKDRKRCRKGRRQEDKRTSQGGE